MRGFARLVLCPKGNDDEMAGSNHQNPIPNPAQLQRSKDEINSVHIQLAAAQEVVREENAGRV